MLVNNFLIPLAATIVIEEAVALLMGYRDKQSMSVIAAVNILTNPLVNFIALLIIYFGLRSYFYWFVLTLELMLIPTEWMMLSYAIPQKRNEFLKLSAVMNVSSFIIGLIII